MKGPFRVFRVEQVEMTFGTQASNLCAKPSSGGFNQTVIKKTGVCQDGGGPTEMGPRACARKAWTTKGSALEEGAK